MQSILYIWRILGLFTQLVIAADLMVIKTHACKAAYGTKTSISLGAGFEF